MLNCKMNNQNNIKYPVLIIADDGWVDLIDDSKGLSSWNYIAINKYNKRGVWLYDSSNTVWQLHKLVPEKPATFLRLLLAQTFYNPSVEVSVQLVKHNDENNDKIIAAINKAIDKDDDILTQTIEAEDLKTAIKNKTTFEELIATLKGKGAI